MVLFVSLVAVVVNCYPILFCGKSFVSPASFGPLVYSWPPLVPGMKPSPVLSRHGSDTAAMMLWGVPVGFIESRSILQYGELPLWDRYGHAGEALISQAVSMLGDPLQWIVIFGRGSAEAWDIKFLAAKFLFCVGFGLLVLKLLGSHPLSMMYAALAAYCGAFFYIDNHLAFFVFAYAPWILLSAVSLLELQSNRYLRWGLVWLLANFSCFNAGHIEVAVVLIGGLNAAAMIHALTNGRTFSEWARVVGRMTAGTLLFLALTAPMWMSFLADLPGSYSSHADIYVFQLPFQTFLGAFDDLFYLLLRADDTVAAAAPATSLLIFVGCSVSLFAWRQLRQERFYWINGGAIIWWSGCIFGGIPASLLAAVPFLNRVGHTHTDFSYLLVIHLTLQSAYGFKSLAALANFRQVVLRLSGAVALLAGLTLLYCRGPFNHHPIPWDYLVCVGAAAVGAPLLYGWLKSRHRPITVVGWAGIVILAFIPQFRFGLYTFGDDKLLLLPGARTVLNAPSPSVDKIQAEKTEACRVVGFQSIFFGNYAAVYGLEDIRSCAPLTGSEYMDLLQKCLGITPGSTWVVNLADPVAKQPLLNLLNVKYVLTPPQVRLADAVDFKIVDRGDFGVVENLEVWPRAFFTDQVIPISDTAAFIQYLWTHGKRPFAAMTEAEIARRPGVSALESTNAATVVAATHYVLLPNSTSFDIHAPSAGMVCLTETAAKDFVARVNHEPQPILTVNRAFKGVYLDRPGDYHIEFVYRPHLWRLACALFWTGIGAAALLGAVEFIRGGSRKKARQAGKSMET
jgi:hypothetical protein